MVLSLQKQSPVEEIIGENVILRKLQLNMAEKIYCSIDADRSRLYQFLPWVDSIKTIEDEKEYLKVCIDNWVKNEEFIYGIFRKNDYSYVGNVCLHNINWTYNKLEIGYWIISNAEGKGFVKESVSLLETAAFNLGFNRIEIKCSTKNIRSMTIPLRLGYRLEGINYQDIIINGTYEDSMCFAKLHKHFLF